MTRTGLVIAFLCAAGFGALAAQQPVADTDVFWHLATARDALSRGVGGVDFFSWTAAGSRLAADQWLGQIALYAAYVAGEWRGIVALRTLAVVALLLCVIASALPAARGRPLIAIVASVPAIFLTKYVWVDRPELFGLVCFALLLVLLRAGRAGSDRALFAAAALIAVWANVHGSFALGVVVTLLVAAEGLWGDRARRRAYVLTVAGALVAPLLTPALVGVWSAPGSHFLSPPREIAEWGVVDPRTPVGMLYVATLALVIACAFVGRATPARELVVLVPVTFLSFTAIRQAPLLAIAAAPLFAARLDALASRYLALRPMRPAPPRADALVGGAAAVLLAVAIGLAPAALDESIYPVAALGALPPGPGLFHEYDWGGWLIWRAPGTPVFVDGRLVPYRGAILDDYRAVMAAAPTWQQIVARRGIRAILVRPSEPLATRARDVGWRQVASSDHFVLLVPPR